MRTLKTYSFTQSYFWSGGADLGASNYENLPSDVCWYRGLRSRRSASQKFESETNLDSTKLEQLRGRKYHTLEIAEMKADVRTLLFLGRGELDN